MTDRDVLRDEIERDVIIHNATAKGRGVPLKAMQERDKTITVLPGGPKFIFLPDDTLKSIIKAGKAYDSNGERRYVAPKGNSRKG
jgi:hypothetical protein